MDPLITVDQLKAYVKAPTLDDYRSMVFEAVAFAIPTMGRDFNVVVEEAEGGNVKVALKSSSLVGEMFIRYLRGNLVRILELVKQQKHGVRDDDRKTAKSGTVTVL